MALPTVQVKSIAHHERGREGGKGKERKRGKGKERKRGREESGRGGGGGGKEEGRAEGGKGRGEGRGGKEEGRGGGGGKGRGEGRGGGERKRGGEGGGKGRGEGGGKEEGRRGRQVWRKGEGGREEEREGLLTRTLHSEGGVVAVLYTATHTPIPSPAGVLSSVKLLHTSNHQGPIVSINDKKPVLQDVCLAHVRSTHTLLTWPLTDSPLWNSFGDVPHCPIQ